MGEMNRVLFRGKEDGADPSYQEEKRTQQRTDRHTRNDYPTVCNSETPRSNL